MGIWNFLGGNKIGPGHPRYERWIRKEKERQQERREENFKSICRGIMLRGMPGAKDELNNYEEIISVLKRFPNCPKFKDDGITWGDNDLNINNWKQAQEWLKAKENPNSENPEYIKQLEERNKDLEERIKKLEKKFVEYENE